MILFPRAYAIFKMSLTFYINMIKLQPLTNKSPESIAITLFMFINFISTKLHINAQDDIVRTILFLNQEKVINGIC